MEDKVKEQINAIIELCQKENDLICEMSDTSNNNNYPNDVINNIFERNKKIISKISEEMFKELLINGEVDTEKYTKIVEENDNIY